jgi:hypothetical protein
MASIKRRYGKEEFARRGDAIYESALHPHLKPEDKGRFVALDIDTSEFEIDDDELAACDRLRARLPDAQIWMVRVGSRYVHRFGGREKMAFRTPFPKARQSLRQMK